MVISVGYSLFGDESGEGSWRISSPNEISNFDVKYEPDQVKIMKFFYKSMIWKIMKDSHVHQVDGKFGKLNSKTTIAFRHFVCGGRGCAGFNSNRHFKF